MEVNFLGVVNCVKAVEEYFKNKKNGHISIVSSLLDIEVCLNHLVIHHQKHL